MGLQGKIAIITGSGRGIGRAIALRLARDGATVVVNELEDAALAEGVAAEAKALGVPSLAVLADVSQAEEAQRLIEATVRAFGGVHILVNNAGINRDAFLLRMSEEDWDQVLKIDLKAAFLCTRAGLKPMLKERWGRVVNIASIVGLAGNPGQANYAAAKAGLIGFTKTVAKEVVSRGITVNAVAPGFIDTAMTQRLRQDIKTALLQQIPMGRFGSPEDVAHAVAFLASEEASYITGHVLTVDGGMVMP